MLRRQLAQLLLAQWATPRPVLFGGHADMSQGLSEELASQSHIGPQGLGKASQKVCRDGPIIADLRELGLGRRASNPF